MEKYTQVAVLGLKLRLLLGYVILRVLYIIRISMVSITGIMY